MAFLRSLRTSLASYSAPAYAIPYIICIVRTLQYGWRSWISQAVVSHDSEGRYYLRDLFIWAR